jgi:ribosomal protein S18 acetylase RimI-like enzyme
MSVLTDSKKIDLRTVVPEDAEFLFRVYTSSRADEVATWGLDHIQLEGMLRMQFRAQQFQYDEIEESGKSIILWDDSPVGRLIVDRTESLILLAEIALLPEYRGAGIGSRIIQELMAEAAEKGLPLCLHVDKANPALRLYQRLGFAIVKDTGTHFEMIWDGSKTE